jgi:hypothetical protein
MTRKLIEMLAFKRPQGSDTQKDFCIEYLHPVFGKPDRDGNYIKSIGNKPNIAFTAHHDTVHMDDGIQVVVVQNDIARLSANSTSNCLGADCTTGIWLILEMIRNKIPGLYLIHSGEEIGCVGSKALVKRNPKWLNNLDAVISFDRKGTKDIITHQMGHRTCSEAFADSLNRILGMGHEPDPTGSYTDSNEYSYKVKECTNLSVGYYSQHSRAETQDLFYANNLLNALLTADWDSLVFARDPSVIEYAYENIPASGRNWYDREPAIYQDYIAGDWDELTELVAEYPSQVANILKTYGLTVEDIIEEIGEKAYYRNYQ